MTPPAITILISDGRGHLVASRVNGRRLTERTTRDKPENANAPLWVELLVGIGLVVWGLVKHNRTARWAGGGLVLVFVALGLVDQLIQS